MARAHHPQVHVQVQVHVHVQAGVFGADMQVSLVNDGPVTVPLTIR